MYNEITANKRRSIILTMAFIVFLIFLGYIYSRATGDQSYGMIWTAIIFSLGSTAVSYFWGDSIALWTNGAKPMDKNENQMVYRLVENLCLADGLPMPKIYLLDDPAINAFATGRKPELASVSITQGALDKLTKEELEGVVAHELSHVKNFDILFMTLVSVLVGSVAILAHLFLRSNLIFGGRRDNDREGGGQLAIVFMVIGVVLAILSPLIANLIKLAVSRRREYLADASGSLLTRYPEGLARALEKIAAENLTMEHASEATAHLYLANPFASSKWKSLFSTHPPIEERIKKLRTMGV